VSYYSGKALREGRGRKTRNRVSCIPVPLIYKSSGDTLKTIHYFRCSQKLVHGIISVSQLVYP